MASLAATAVADLLQPVHGGNPMARDADASIIVADPVASDAVEIPSAPPSSPSKGADGPLTYAGNRVLLATRRKPSGTFRVAVIGDSMSYGAGVPYRKAFSARLASHLNSAVPGTWVECVSFGVSGACIHHAAGRAITHALPADSALVIIAVCCNDA